MIIILVIIFVIILIFLQDNNDTVSRFTNYKKITVVPRKLVYQKIQFNIPPHKILYTNIAKNIKSIFPIDNINNSNYEMTNLSLSNHHENMISVIPTVCKYNSDYENIRYISSIGVEQLTLFSNKKISGWSMLIGQTIATLSKKSASYITLLRIKTLLNIDFNIKTLQKIDLNVVDDLKNNKYQAVFLLTSHPNNTIKSINRLLPLTFIGISGIDKDNINTVFPDMIRSKLDLSYYNIYNSMPDTLLSTLDIVCNKDLTSETSYLLVKTIFKNYLNLKTNGDDDYKLHMKEFHPENMYLSNNIYKLHSGVKKFYIDIGLITYNKSKFCSLKAGAGRCNVKKINHFLLL